MIQLDKNKIASNKANSGVLYEVKANKVRKLTDCEYTLKIEDFHYSPQLLQNSIKHALKLHSKIDAIIIGWDVKITNKKYYFLEGNFGPGNIWFDDYYYLDKFNFIKNIDYC